MFTQNSSNISIRIMFTTRSRLTENIAKRQRGRKIVNLTATGINVPLTNTPVDWSLRWCTVPMDTTHQLYREIYEFEVKDDDVYIVTFPKCGTTWIQEATWLLVNNLDFTTANNVDLPYRSVFMDMSVLYSSIQRNTVDLARKATTPRVLKTHFPAHLIPTQIWDKRSKIIYCTRNPKDTAVSYYHFHKGLGTWNGNIDEFVEDFVNNDIMYTPYWEHVMDFWQMRNEDNIFFTSFEKMKRDLKGVLVELNQFLEKPELSDEDLKKLEQHLSFENMKANRHTNPTFNIKSGHGSPNVKSDFEFMRRGVIGSFKDELSPDTQEKLNDWIDVNLSKYNIKLEDVFGKF